MFSHLFLSLPDGITSWDPSGAGISANLELYKAFNDKNVDLPLEVGL